MLHKIQKTINNKILSLEILTISEVILVKRMKTAEWTFIDLYKIAPNFPFNISLFGTIQPERGEDRNSSAINLIARATSASRRKNMQGLVIPCGLAVSVKYYYMF